MRKYLLLLSLIGLLVSCGINEEKNGSTLKITEQHGDSVFTQTERQVIIDELKRLHNVFTSNDTGEIANLFRFPVSNEIIGIYIDDSTFNAQLDENGNKVTKEMFFRHYREISSSLQFDQMQQLFKRLNVDNLLLSDSLHQDVIMKAEPCFRFYSVTLENYDVTITIGTNSNKDYKSNNLSTDDIPENDSSICEHQLMWRFKFDGKKLHLEKIEAAG